MSIIYALACFGLAVLLHGLAMRFPLRVDVVRRFLLVGIPLGVALVVFALTALDFTIDAFAAILLYAFLCELYIFCFTLVLSSVSATMLVLLHRGAIEESTLASAYDPRGMVKLRVDRLIKHGFIERRGERLAVSPRGKLLHDSFSVLRSVFGHDIE